MRLLFPIYIAYKLCVHALKMYAVGEAICVVFDNIIIRLPSVVMCIPHHWYLLHE